MLPARGRRGAGLVARRWRAERLRGRGGAGRRAPHAGQAPERAASSARLRGVPEPASPARHLPHVAPPIIPATDLGGVTVLKRGSADRRTIVLTNPEAMAARFPAATRHMS